MILYGLARALKPEYVVETGIAAGVSTSFLGAALIENGRGGLFSIELPRVERGQRVLADGSVYSWHGNGVGWAIPHDVRRGLENRHRIILQDVRHALPELLEELPCVDLFFHDDLHTPDHMLWEYEAVWAKLSPRGCWFPTTSITDGSNFAPGRASAERRFITSIDCARFASPAGESRGEMISATMRDWGVRTMGRAHERGSETLS